MSKAPKELLLGLIKEGNLKELKEISSNTNHELYKEFISSLEYYPVELDKPRLKTSNGITLLEVPTVSIEAIESDNISLLFLACKYGKFEIFKWLKADYPHIFEQSLEMLTFSDLSSSLYGTLELITCHYNHMNLLKYICEHVRELDSHEIESEFGDQDPAHLENTFITGFVFSSNMEIYKYLWDKYSSAIDEPFAKVFETILNCAPEDLEENLKFKTIFATCMLYLHYEHKLKTCDFANNFIPKALQSTDNNDICAFFDNTEGFEELSLEDKEGTKSRYRPIFTYLQKFCDIGLELKASTMQSIQEIADSLGEYCEGNIDLLDTAKEKFLDKPEVKAEAKFSLLAKSIKSEIFPTEVIAEIAKFSSNNPDFDFTITKSTYLLKVLNKDTNQDKGVDI